MSDSTAVVLGILAIAAVIWARRIWARQPTLRIVLLIVAVLFAYPAINSCYIRVKQSVAGPPAP